MITSSMIIAKSSFKSLFINVNHIYIKIIKFLHNFSTKKIIFYFVPFPNCKEFSSGTKTPFLINLSGINLSGSG